VLAAGAGTRFGGGKMRAMLDGRPILQHVLDRLADAGLDDVVVVLGDDADEVGEAIAWRHERRIRNPDPARGLSGSVRLGMGAVHDDVDAALFVLGDQPRVAPEAIRALLDAGVDEHRPITVPTYEGDAGRNPVLLGRAAFGLAERTDGDRGLGPLLASHPELVRAVPVPAGVRDNPDVDTRADLVAALEAGWADRVHANNDQVDRFREVPDATDFYAPVTSLFRADPTRTDEPALASLLALVQPGETWLDIGAGAGRYALPIARALAPSEGIVVAVDPSAGMLDGLRSIAAEYAIGNVRVVEGRWPAVAPEAGSADVTLIAHVSYDIAAIGPFVSTMEAAARRLCVAVLMERQPSSIADVCWPPVWGEARVSLPALPDFVELLRARGRTPAIERLERAPRRFATRDELENFLRRQLWVEPGGAADHRFVEALEPLIVIDDEGRVGLHDQAPMPIGVVTWTPGGSP
jgi:CTP:molybdopterin cytidylyltransferase MocA/SAM-dependent methyltransferase